MLFSCQEKTNDSDVSAKISEKDAFVELSETLNRFNDTYGINKETKGWVRKTLLSDLSGFFWGSLVHPGIGLFTGIGASVLCFPFFYISRDEAEDSGISLNQKAMIPTDGPLSEYNDFGYIHNSIIMKLYEEDNTFSYTWSREKLFDRIDYWLRFYPRRYQQVDREKFNEIIDNVIAMRSMSIDDTFESLSQKAPDKREELQIIKEYCLSLDAIENAQTLEQYTKGFNDIVWNSDITDESKETIISSVSVAGNSCLLWEEKYAD